MKNAIEALFHPNGVAVVGASAKRGKIGNILIRNLLESGIEIFPVNPGDTEIEGIRCYRSIYDVPAGVEMAIIALPSENTVEEVKNAADRGIKCIIVVSAGFSESGVNGQRLQEEMIEYARMKGSRILGPNTLGIFSPVSGIDTLLIPRERSPRPGRGKLGIISQSGSVQISLLEKAATIGLGISYCIGLGNRGDISEIDLLQFLALDEDTACMAVYLESFHDGKRLIDVCSTISPVKPIVAIKAGRTSAGTRAASSHTGAIARGSDEIVEGVFRQAGIIRANDDEELLDLANALLLMSHAAGDHVAYVGSAGGIGVMASDYIESEDDGVGLRMAELTEDTRTRLHEVLEEFAPVTNPVDLTANSSPEQYDSAVRLVLSDPNVDILLLSIDMQPPMMNDGVFRHIPSWIGMKKPIVGTSTGGPIGESTIRKMQSLGIPAYPSLRRCAGAIRALRDRGVMLRRLRKS